ncbi:hypothetical protein CONPUDRAFT_85873 [Coniophora puteana RWD-64-598 SS2]|uniref:Uncharacterized protein n=1 Tax=Coniophora puteana (strain RWD-64-598) TaxID=741705 RepID=R7SE01_CONPW|nr:uncharacterized protein CONPUDRAFT_85873 [Coniophora puteana RWD-64-598 SS2]EIW74398.1 hypothetical protein CONPUDRAFT_85873 [Coniophora puteana RWD-64-598 SS2]
MNSFFNRSPKRGPKTRKSTISKPMGCPLAPSSSIMNDHPKPLHIITEDAEPSDSESSPISRHNPASSSTSSLVSSRHSPSKPRISLSAFAFSIDEALKIVGGSRSRAPVPPSLSSSSSTSGSSDSLPLRTPVTSDGESDCEESSFALPSPRLRPRPVTIRPLYISKSRSLDIADSTSLELEELEEGRYEYTDLPTCIITPTPEMEFESDIIESVKESSTEDDHDFYTRQFADFISLYSPLPPSFPVGPSAAGEVRRDSASLPTIPEVSVTEEEPSPVSELAYTQEKKPLKKVGRSRHSKPLPLLPPPSATSSVFRHSLLSVPVPIIRQPVPKRVIPISSLLPPPPTPTRPPPKMSIPDDIEFECEPELAEELVEVEVEEEQVEENGADECASTRSLVDEPRIIVERVYQSSRNSHQSQSQSQRDYLQPRVECSADARLSAPLSEDEKSIYSTLSAFSFPSSPVACASNAGIDVDLNVSFAPEFTPAFSSTLFSPSFPSFPSFPSTPRSSSEDDRGEEEEDEPRTSLDSDHSHQSCPEADVDAQELDMPPPHLRSRWSMSTLASAEAEREHFSLPHFSLSPLKKTAFFSRSSRASSSPKSPKSPSKKLPFGVSAKDNKDKDTKDKDKAAAEMKAKDKQSKAKTDERLARARRLSNSRSPITTPRREFALTGAPPRAQSHAFGASFHLSPPPPSSSASHFGHARGHSYSPASPSYSSAFPAGPSGLSLQAQQQPAMKQVVRRKESRWSTSSHGSAHSSVWGGSDCGSCVSDGSQGLRRKPIPVEMFLRA